MGYINLSIDDDLKRKLKAKLALEEKTMTQWLTEQAKIYLKGGDKTKKK